MIKNPTFLRENHFKNATSLKLSLFHKFFEPEEGNPAVFLTRFFLSASDTNCQITFLFQQHHQREKLHVQKIAKRLGGILEASICTVGQ